MNVASPEPWSCALAPIEAREIPDDVAERLQLRPDVVEELSDGLRKRGIDTSIDLSGYVTNRDAFVGAGPVLTVRYAPKRVRDDEQRLGHAQIAAAAIPGCVILADARGCEGAVLGGMAAETIRSSDAAIYVLDGMARDVDEITAAGLIVLAARFGVQSGRPTTQAIAIGEPMTFVRTYVASGDVAVVNRYGLVIIPSWLSWDDVRALI